MYCPLTLSVAQPSSIANNSSYRHIACSLALAIALSWLQVHCPLSSDAREFAHGINGTSETRTIKMGCSNCERNLFLNDADLQCPFYRLLFRSIIPRADCYRQFLLGIHPEVMQRLCVLYMLSQQLAILLRSMSHPEPHVQREANGEILQTRVTPANFAPSHHLPLPTSSAICTVPILSDLHVTLCKQTSIILPLFCRRSWSHHVQVKCIDEATNSDGRKSNDR